MSEAFLPRPRMVGARREFSIIASEYNPEFVQGMVDAAAAELHATNPQARVTLVRVPGAFEIPLAAQYVAKEGIAHAILALGVILMGETDHGENIARTITDALMRVSLETGIPVVYEVLTVNSVEQARRRCLEGELNRGTEAARVASEMARIVADFRNAK
jgi:6,7-dimethyl-8-ribityllumazine synthase